MLKIGNVELKNRIIFAPMAGISNSSYRTIIKSMDAALVCSEMISSLGILYNGNKTVDLLKFNDNERPISIQLFGGDKESLVYAAKYVYENIHPDIIDINMGCPVPKVAIKSKAGSYLMKNPKLVKEIVSSIVKSVPIPITVKIRSGWNDENINAVEIAKTCEEAGASAITIHPRTRSQGYSGLSNWNIIKDVKKSVKIPVIGNGDIKSIEDAKKMLDETDCDAIMIARGALGNPWFIKECIEYIENNNIIEKPSYKDRIDMIFIHYNILKNNTTEKIAISEIKTHALWYLKYIPGSKEIKKRIVQIEKEEELYNVLSKFKETL